MVRAKYVVASLLVISAVGFLLRTYLPYHSVFYNIPSTVSFLEPDAYNRMWYAREIVTAINTDGFWPAFLYTVHNSLLFSFVIALLSQFGNIEVIGAWLPPMLAVATILLVYGIGATFNRYIGLAAAFFTAIIPSEFLHRSLLGFTDHHVMETLLMVLVIFLFIKALTKWQWAIGAGTALFLYIANWTGGLVFVVILLIAAGTYFAYGLLAKHEWKRAVGIIGLAVVIALLLYLPLGGYARYTTTQTWLAPTPTGEALPVNTTSNASALVSLLLPNLYEPTISETMPLFYPIGQFDVRVVTTNLNVLFFTFLAGYWSLWRRRRERATLLIATWSLALFALTILQRRYLYYLTVNVAVLSALFTWDVAVWLMKQKGTAVMFALIVLTISFPSVRPALNISAYGKFQITPDWQSALTWLKTQPNEGYVTAWSDYGHWIKYVSGHDPNLMPGPGGSSVAQLLLTTDDSQIPHLIANLDTEYLIIDARTQRDVVWAVGQVAGMKPTSRSVQDRLWRGEPVKPFVLAYENATVKLFKVN